WLFFFFPNCIWSFDFLYFPVELEERDGEGRLLFYGSINTWGKDGKSDINFGLGPATS
uniref:Uncharacterized protein n=1 Tax=Oryza brachyantha TaxID=4533 RepID=J3MPE7_ORYBR